MKIVIQCAATKDPGAGHMRTAGGHRVLFVGDPSTAPATNEYVYARPDDPSDDGRSWRERLLRYNETPGTNPLGLARAYELYADPAYRDLAKGVGIENLFILSAGWGLIPASFLTPAYDITFSASAESWQRRRAGDVYHDFRIARQDGVEPLVFLGGEDYLPLFAAVTKGYEGRRVALHNLRTMPRLDGVELVRYPATTSTDWHYESARALLDGRFPVHPPRGMGA